MLKTVVLVASLAFATSAMAAGSGIGGSYDVFGTNPDGTAYKGSVTIVVTTDHTCHITWKTESTTSSGICMQNGDAFTAAYELSGKVGLAIYEISKDGSMIGNWTIADQAGVGTEMLTPQ